MDSSSAAPARGSLAALPRDMSVAQAIKDIRLETNLSRHEMGAMLGVPVWQVVAWERGWRDPCARSVAMLSRMADDDGATLLTALAGPRVRSSLVAADLHHLRPGSGSGQPALSGAHGQPRPDGNDAVPS